MLFDIANNELRSLSKWITANKLYVNYDKTNFMLFEPKIRTTQNQTSLLVHKHLLFNGHVIEQVHSVKYLGVIIDDQLNWSEHINSLIGKVSSMTGILYRYGNFLPISCKRNIYFALIYSSIIYCIEVYANTTKALLNPLIIKCNRLLRLLQNKSRRTHIYDLYSTFNTLPVDLLFQYYTAKFIHRCLYNPSDMPKVVSNWFTRNSNQHPHNTRNKNNFFLQSNINPKSILFYGPSLWSKLSIELQNNPSLHSFLKHYKLSLVMNLKSSL